MKISKRRYIKLNNFCGKLQGVVGFFGFFGAAVFFGVGLALHPIFLIDLPISLFLLCGTNLIVPYRERTRDKRQRAKWLFTSAWYES